MFLSRNQVSFYQNYGNFLNEQGAAVISSDLQQRLKGYLSDEKTLSKLAEIFSKYDTGEFELTDLDKTQFGILPEDRLWVKVDLTDKKAPKFFMWILNDEFLWGDVDLDTAAALLYAAGSGYGTDEETIGAIAGAITRIAAEKSADPEIYFEQLDKKFTEKYGKSIKTFFEDEFSGYAEIVALNTYRRKIEPSVMRGLNIWTILGDVALTIITFGGSAAFTAGLKGSQTAAAAARASKATKFGKGTATASTALGKATKTIANITGLSKVFGKLDKARKVAALEKAGIKAGGNAFPWITKGGQGAQTQAKVIAYTDNGVEMSILGSNGKWATAVSGWDNVITQLAPATASTALTAAGVNLTTAGVLAAKKAGESEPGQGEPGMVAKGAELMGYYDTLAADPNAYLANAKQQGASDIASMLLDLKNGGGIFGNTTDQEECSIALLVTGLTPEMAKEVDAQYSKIDVKDDVYSVLDDELGGDISILAKAYWTGATGKGDEFAPAIENILGKIKKTK